ncbi:MAG TPA: polysaccharide biosynthesis tyrosine autokinase [Longimicrobiaceae bacterium]|nr:polysaccharide biosynthesis tyrosine autokinase [Longimicrobiaceae bacterium]
MPESSEFQPDSPVTRRVRTDYGAAHAALAAESGEGVLNLREVFDSLRRNRWWIVLAAAVSLGATSYLLSRQAVVYQAAAFLRLRGPSVATSDLVDQPTQKTSIVPMDPITSELMVLQGRGVVGEVVDHEGLRLVSASDNAPPAVVSDVAVTLPPEVMDSIRLTFGAGGVTAVMGGQKRTAAYGSPIGFDHVRFTVRANPGVASASWVVLPRMMAINRVTENLQARPRQGTDGIDVAYRSVHPAVATRVVNEIVQVYQEVNARSAQQTSTRRRVFLHQQLGETDSLLTEAQLELSHFRSTEQAYSTRDKFTGEQSQIMQLDAQRESLESDRRLYQSLLSGLVTPSSEGVSSRIGALVAAPGISANPVIGQLAGQLSQYERARDSMIVWGRTPEHPDVRQLSVAMKAAQARLVEAVRAQIRSLDLQLASLNAQRDSNVASLQHLSTTEATELQLTQRVETLRSIGDELRQEYEKARIAEAVEAGQVEIVNLAQGAFPTDTNRTQKLALGLMFGLLLGVGGALLRETLNTSIRRRDEVQRVLHVPGLAVIPPVGSQAQVRVRAPKLLGPGKKPARQPATSVARLEHVAPSGEAQEAYRMLRNNILFSQGEQQLRSLVVTSTAPGEGKTMTAINLAVALAEQGQHILLVSCDFRRPRLESQLGIPREPGLTDVLLQEVRMTDAILLPGIENLSVLPCGSLSDVPVELLGGRRMESALAWFQREYDMVIIDSPPLLAASEAGALAAKADGVLLVVRAGQTQREAAQLAMQQLGIVGANVIGAVLNDPDAEVPQYGGYYKYDYTSVG